MSELQNSINAKNISYSTEFSIGNTKFIIFLAVPDENENAVYEQDFKPVSIYHNHYYNELIFSSLFEIQCFTKDDSFKLHRNRFLLFKAGFFHATTINLSMKANILGFTFKEIEKCTANERTYDIYNKIFSLDYQVFSNKSLVNTLKQIFQQIHSPTLFSYYSIPALLQIFFVQVAEKYATPTSKLTSLGSLDYRISVELNSMETNTSLRTMAKKLFISERQLERRIYQLYGKSFMEKRREVRISVAKNLLETTSLTIEQIAIKIHYGSQSAFIAAFKRDTAMTPTQYRKNFMKIY